MLRLQRYLLGELLGAFALVLLILTGIFLTGSLLQVLQRFPQLSGLALLQSVPLFLGLALPVVVPVSFLIACLFSYGRFADDNEFLAFQMGGLSPRHAAAPAICAAVVLSIATVALSCDVNPMLTGAKKSILRGEIREQVERMRSPAATNVKLADMEMSWNGRDGEWYREVYLTWTSEESSGGGAEKTKRTNRANAARATVKLTDTSPVRLVITLEDARMPTATGSGLTTFEGRLIPIVIDLGDDRADTKNRDEMRAAELYYRMVRLEPLLGRARETGEWRAYRLYAGEYWRRVALGLSPLAFALLGVPLGLIVRRSSRAQALALGLIVVVPVYYALLLWGDNLSRIGALPPPLGLNLANLVLGAAGLGLIVRLCTR